MTAQPVQPVDTGAVDALDFTLADLRHYINRLSDEVPVALDFDDTTETVVRLLHDLRTQRKALAEIEAFVEAAAVKRLPWGKSQIGDLLVDVKGGTDRKVWEHDRLAWEVCQSIAVDDNGEVVPEIAQIINQARSRILNCASVAYWRTNQLRPLGIDPDNFCQKVPGRRTVALTPAIDGQLPS